MRKHAGKLIFLAASIFLSGSALANGHSDLPKRSPSILVFVSFSMPRVSLIALKKQTEAAGASLVFRGFFNNSIRETMEKIQNTFSLKSRAGSGIQINPIFFQKYAINSVPCVVVQRKNMRGQRSFDKICGNATLPSLLENIQEARKK